MRVFVNGREDTSASALDRGLFYGQSVFETIAIVNGRPALLDEHLTRLSLGCEKLSIPLNIKALHDDINAFSSEFSGENLVLRLMVSMGPGGRGYKNPDDQQPCRILSLHPYPEISYENGIVIGISDVRLGNQPLLAGIKHGNRLEQILVRESWKEDWQEALVLDYDDNVIEGTQSNLFVVNGKTVKTPLIDRCGVEGVMRNWVMDQLKVSGFSCSAMRLSVSDITDADEVFLTNSVLGIQSVSALHTNNRVLSYSTAVIANKLQKTLLKHDLIPSI